MLSFTLQVHPLPRHRLGAWWEHLVMISCLYFSIKIKRIWHALPKLSSSSLIPCSSYTKPVACVLYVPFILHICVAQRRKEPAPRSSGSSGSGTWLSSTAFAITVTDACEVNQVVTWSISRELWCSRSNYWPLATQYKKTKQIILQTSVMFMCFSGQYVGLVDYSFHRNQKNVRSKRPRLGLSTLDCAQQTPVTWWGFFYDYRYCGAEHFVLLKMFFYVTKPLKAACGLVPFKRQGQILAARHFCPLHTLKSYCVKTWASFNKSWA